MTIVGIITDELNAQHLFNGGCGGDQTVVMFIYDHVIFLGGGLLSETCSVLCFVKCPEKKIIQLILSDS